MKTLTKISVMGLALWFVLVAWQQYHRSADLFFFGKGQSFLVVVDPLTPIIMQVSLETHSRYVYTGWDKTPSWFLEHISADGCTLGAVSKKLDYQLHDWYFCGYCAYFDGPKVDHYEIWLPFTYFPLLWAIICSILPIRWLCPRWFKRYQEVSWRKMPFVMANDGKRFVGFTWHSMRWYAVGLRWLVLMAVILSAFVLAVFVLAVSRS